MREDYVDVLIIGAGLSGIGAACHLQKHCPEKSYHILEMRGSIGGTWDLFRYPGIRSDSDMFTLGYNFKPWQDQKAIADGPSILKYVRETAKEHGIEERISYNHKVLSARWDSGEACWHVTIEADGTRKTLRAGWLHSCAGYYRYSKGYTPNYKGRETFQGTFIHPQHWPETLDYSDKKIVVIGSGATAVTLVPAMAKTAKSVTMLQRSPSYIFPRPAEDKGANFLRRHLPARLAYRLIRWRNVLLQQYFFTLARKFPEKAKAKLITTVEKEVGPGFDMEKHFTPAYNPWDQRVCLVPDSDLFKALKSGKAAIVTEHIDRFDAGGIHLTNGDYLEADIIVSATGLDLVFMGEITLEVDGRVFQPNELFVYKGLMLSYVPNATSVFGYTNASWTLRADLSSEFLCRVLKHMDTHNYVEARPIPEGLEADEALFDFTSSYMKRAEDRLPRRGKKSPWVFHQNYALDLIMMRYGRISENYLHFRRRSDDLHEQSKSAAAHHKVAAE